LIIAATAADDFGCRDDATLRHADTDCFRQPLYGQPIIATLLSLLMIRHFADSHAADCRRHAPASFHCWP